MYILGNGKTKTTTKVEWLEYDIDWGVVEAEKVNRGEIIIALKKVKSLYLGDSGRAIK